MRWTAEQVEAEALRLSPEERARLAARLIASLDEETRAARAWIEEANRRYALARAGEMGTVPASEVIARMRAQPPFP